MNYDSMKRDELLKECSDKGIKGVSKLKKDDLIDVLLGKPRSAKKSIPKRVRDQLWRSKFDTLNGECYSCKVAISFDNFEAGHIVAESKGGETDLNNLLPVCSPCNRSMGTMNMEEFKEMLVGPQKIQNLGWKKILRKGQYGYIMEGSILQKIQIGHLRFKFIPKCASMEEWEKLFNDLENKHPGTFKTVMGILDPIINLPKVSKDMDLGLLKMAIKMLLNRINLENIGNYESKLKEAGYLTGAMANYMDIKAATHYGSCIRKIPGEPFGDHAFSDDLFGRFVKTSGNDKIYDLAVYLNDVL